MGCCGSDREKNVSEEQKWNYITLSDFRSKGCIPIFSYIWLWGAVLITVGVYVADTFTAVNLIAFNRWSGTVKPAIPFEVSKWIFFVCICLSWALCAFEWIRAVRVMRKGGVADSYLDPLAAVLQSIRLGKGQGWRRFLVFAELTKSKKGADYAALFVYFNFKGAVRILIAEGPRVVVNAVTLYSVFKLDLDPNGEHGSKDGRSGIQQFFANLEALADSNREQTVILSSMLFTTVVWAFSAISLLLSVIMFLMFLWHYIPSADGSLSRYCRRKVDQRLDRIVGKKTQKALQKEEAKRIKYERKEALKNGEKLPQSVRQPTLPSLNGYDDTKSESGLSRMDSMSTLPPYSSNSLARTNTMNTTASDRTGISRAPTLPDFGDGLTRPVPTRTDTQSSYGSNAPLLSDAGSMGYGEPGRPASPAPSLPPLNTNFPRGPTPRTMMPGSAGPRPYTPGSDRGPGSAMGFRGPPNGYGPRPGPGMSRQNTGFSDSSGGRNSPGPRSGGPSPGPMGMGMGKPMGPTRQNTYNSITSAPRHGPSPLSSDPSFSPYDTQGAQASGPSYEMSPVEGSPLRQAQAPYSQQGQGVGLNSSNYNPYAGSNDDDYDPYRPRSAERITPVPQQQLQSQPPPQPRAFSPFDAAGQGRMSPAPSLGRNSPAPPPPQAGGLPPRPLPSAVLQSAMQRRDLSSPLPGRGGAGSVPPHLMQRSATGPVGSVGQDMYAQNREPVGRSATAGPRGQGQDGYGGW